MSEHQRSSWARGAQRSWARDSPPAPHTHTKHLGRSPPSYASSTRIQSPSACVAFDPSSVTPEARSRRACESSTVCPNAHWAQRHTSLRCQSCCDAARRLTCAFRASRAPCSCSGAPLRTARCAQHSLPHPLMHPLSLFLSHALHIHKSPGRRFSGAGCAIPHASPGTALRCRHARRLRVRNLKRRRQQTWPWPNSAWVRCPSWMRKFYLKVRAPSMPNVGSPRGLACTSMQNVGSPRGLACTFRASRAPCSCSGAPLGAAPNTHG